MYGFFFFFETLPKILSKSSKSFYRFSKKGIHRKTTYIFVCVHSLLVSFASPFVCSLRKSLGDYLTDIFDFFSFSENYRSNNPPDFFEGCRQRVKQKRREENAHTQICKWSFYGYPFLKIGRRILKILIKFSEASQKKIKNPIHFFYQTGFEASMPSKTIKIQISN